MEKDAVITTTEPDTGLTNTVKDAAKPDTKLTNTVRQVLMNELGLTRDIIRQEVIDIVGSTVEKFFKDGKFEKFLQQKVDAALRTYQYGSEELQKLVIDQVKIAVQKQILDDIKERVLAKVEIEVKANFGTA